MRSRRRKEADCPTSASLPRRLLGHLRPRVKLLVNVAETVPGNVSIDFGRGDGGVAEEFLNDTEVGAVFEQVSCETMAQHVWCDVSSNAGATDALFDPQPEGDGGERRAAFGDKDVSWRARCNEFGTADGNEMFEGGDGLFAQGQDALFVAFSDDIDETGFEMELL